MSEDREPSTRSELGWWARSSLRDLLEDALVWIAIATVVVVPGVVGYLVAGSDGLVPGLGVGVGSACWWVCGGSSGARATCAAAGGGAVDAEVNDR